MPRIIVTKELAATLKAIRTENKITAKSLALHIGKSQPYISRFEKGDIKSIDKSTLNEILDFIILDKNSISEKVDSILKTATLRFSSEEIENQLWYKNYSTVYCKIPIPPLLIDDINKKIAENNISIEELLARINANESLDTSVLTNKKYPTNEWFYESSKNPEKVSIIINLSQQRIGEILTKKTTSTRYIYILAIAFYLHKFIEYGNVLKLTEGEYYSLLQKTSDYLSSYKFYTLSEKYERISSSLTQNDINTSLSLHDENNLKELINFITAIQVMSDYDVQNTNMMLKQLNSNMLWDKGFMASLFSLPFSEIGKDATYSFKKSLLEKIKGSLVEFINMPEKEKSIEQYN